MVSISIVFVAVPVRILQQLKPDMKFFFTSDLFKTGYGTVAISIIESFRIAICTHLLEIAMLQFIYYY